MLYAYTITIYYGLYCEENKIKVYPDGPCNLAYIYSTVGNVREKLERNNKMDYNRLSKLVQWNEGYC